MAEETLTPNGDAVTEDRPKGLFSKLADVMAEVGYVEKRGRNTFHNYDYVTEADLVEAVRSKLAERQIVLIPSVGDIGERPVTTDKGKQSTVTTVRVKFTFIDGATGETHSAEWAGSGDDASDKGLYKAYTGALKYFLMKAFLIPTGDDPEADGDAKGNGKTTVPRPTSKPAQQTERVATAKQRGLVNGKAGEAKLGSLQLLNVLREAAGTDPVDMEPDEAQAAAQRILDRLPARLVDPVLEGIEKVAKDSEVPF